MFGFSPAVAGIRTTTNQQSIQKKFKKFIETALCLIKWFQESDKPNSVFPENQERGSFILAALPGTVTERAAPRSPIWPCTRWGLPCLADYSLSGGLLLHLFTLTPPWWGGLFSAALAVGMPSRTFRPRVSPFKNDVTRHRALWSSDFPPPVRDRKRSPALLKPMTT